MFYFNSPSHESLIFEPVSFILHSGVFKSSHTSFEDLKRFQLFILSLHFEKTSFFSDTSLGLDHILFGLPVIHLEAPDINIDNLITFFKSYSTLLRNSYIKLFCFFIFLFESSSHFIRIRLSNTVVQIAFLTIPLVPPYSRCTLQFVWRWSVSITVL